MHVNINGQEVRLFAGARVRDGLNAISGDVVDAVLEGSLKVTDAEGHRVYLDGHLNDGDHLLLSTAEKAGPGAEESC